jgi:chloramphenicol 3-O phosphotransferase
VKGVVVILNGMPRSGKTSIAAALQEQRERIWINLGIDHHIRTLPRWLSPGAGLRPFAVEHADAGNRERLATIEAQVPRLYAALYGAAAAHARAGFDVVMDVGHHGAYSSDVDVLGPCHAELEGLTRLFVGVQCPLEEIWRRREETWGQRRDAVDTAVLAAVERGQIAVHTGHDYDLVVDSSSMSPEEAAALIMDALGEL